ncbi:mitochondrial outer membrane import complex protein METAXIN [Dorcoceras hygrometricum]|uniref:Mitochondrial outer membrane import complex protein METAXIN n=1 Tax=Dorcoceras hygrometricum TaxID=472368 RepID=A0A2Z7B5K3_9LAMI|nr:mitochondrial outer membrane import complex protein METAXIN [Dorcoceras hygrometricum]
MGDDRGDREKLTLVARKPSFGLPTACPTCLPVYIYLRFAQIPFNLEFNTIYIDSDQIPFIESGDYVAYNNEKGGVIQNLKEDGIADLDSEVRGIPEWLSMRAMVESWLADAVMYELWVGSDAKSANKIYFSDLPWPIGKVLYYKQVRIVKQVLGITSNNAERREEEIYSRAALAYSALSYKLGDQSLFFENRPTSLDAFFVGHVLFTVHALPPKRSSSFSFSLTMIPTHLCSIPSPRKTIRSHGDALEITNKNGLNLEMKALKLESSVLRNKLLYHANLIHYAENLKMRYLDASSSSSSIPQGDPSSSSEQKPSHWSSKPKSKPKKEKTEEEKKFRRRAKYFLATQLVAVLVFLSIFGGHDDSEVELEDDNQGLLSD